MLTNIGALATKNANFRRVLYTAKNCQFVVMSLHPAEEIGMEVHKLDQFFRVEEGSGEAILDGVRSPISAGFAVIVPAGTKVRRRNRSSLQHVRCSTCRSTPRCFPPLIHLKTLPLLW